MNQLSVVKLVLLSFMYISFHLFAEDQASINSLEKFSPNPLNFVAIDDAKPYAFVLPDGTVTGLYVDFWKLWAKTNDHPLSFSMASFSDAMGIVQSGEAVHIGLFRNPQREAWADFSLPIFSIATGVVFKPNHSDPEDLSEGEGLRVGVLNESFQAGYLAENYPNLQLHLYPEINTAIPQLLNGELDAIVAEVPILQATLYENGLNGVLQVADKKILKNDVHAVVAKGNVETLLLINKGIENIPVKSLNALFNKWLPNQKPFISEFSELTISERNWLRLLPDLDIDLGINSNPFGFLDEKSKQIVGIVPGYINYINDVLNIRLQPKYKNSWSESLDAIKKGDIDLLADIVNTPLRSKELEFTIPYFVADNVIVTLEENLQINSLRSLDDEIVGVMSGYEVELINRDYPNVNLKLVESVIDGLNKVRSRDIDMFVGPIPIINYEINKNQINDLSITAFLPYKLELSMAAREGLEQRRERECFLIKHTAPVHSKRYSPDNSDPSPPSVVFCEHWPYDFCRHG